MFLDFFKMSEQPFGVTPDPRFLYLSKSHREALATLYYGIESERGFVALIAQPGLGKTTLAFQLLEKLQQASRTVFLFQTQRNSKELFQYLLNGLGICAEGMDQVSMHYKLSEILCREMMAGRRFILAIDEAQNLEPEVLEAVRLLSNFETSRDKMLQIILIGQPQLARKLASPELEQLQQRIAMFAKLEPFDAEDTANYIAHRLTIAGYEGDSLFTPEALALIAEHSRGIPRKINALCFSALSLCCASDSKQVSAQMMKDVISDRELECSQPTAAPRPVQPSSVTSRTVLSSYSYSTRPARSFGRWILGAASAAACVAVGLGLFLLPPGRVGRIIHDASAIWSPNRTAAISTDSATEQKSDGEAAASSALNVAPDELANVASEQSPALSTDNETQTVIVLPGDTLRQIILRTIGVYNDDAVLQVRKLNPGIADLSHIETGQTIRIPRLSVPINSGTSDDGKVAPGKN